MECDKKAIEEAVSNVVDGLLDFYVKMRETTLENGEFDFSPRLLHRSESGCFYCFDVEINHGDAKIKFKLGVNSVSRTGASEQQC